MSEEQLPDWLANMRAQPFEDEPTSEEEPLFEEPDGNDEALFVEDEEDEDPLARMMAEAEAAEEEEDVVEGLREMVQSEEDFDYAEDSGVNFSLPSPIPGLKPWQCLVVAVFFFVNVALCGFMLLLLTGRIALPY